MWPRYEIRPPNQWQSLYSEAGDDPGSPSSRCFFRFQLRVSSCIRQQWIISLPRACSSTGGDAGQEPSSDFTSLWHRSWQTVTLLAGLGFLPFSKTLRAGSGHSRTERSLPWPLTVTRQDPPGLNTMKRIQYILACRENRCKTRQEHT